MCNTQKFYVQPTHCIYAFCMDLRTSSDYFAIQNWLTGFYNRDEVCLLRGTDWIFIYNSGKFSSLNCKCPLWRYRDLSVYILCFFISKLTMQWLFGARQSGCGGNPMYNTNTEKDEPFFCCAWHRWVMHSGFNRKILGEESTGEIKRRWQSGI